MTPREAIKRFGLQRADNNGVPGFRIAKGLATPQEIVALVAMKPAIMAEFDLMLNEKEKEKAEAEAQYRASHTFLRVLLVMQDEYLHLHLSACDVITGEGRVFVPFFGNPGISLAHYTPHMDTIRAQGKSHPCGDSMAYEISPEDEEILVREQEVAVAEAAKATALAEAEAQAEKAKEDAIEKGKFDEARVTGKPVTLNSWMEDCNDPREECSTDVVTLYAMPDGTRKINRQHTW